MRYLITILTVFLISTASAYDFTPIKVPTKATITKIYFDGDSRGWAITDAGELLSTHNGGATWTLREINPRPIRDIVIHGRFGYLCGDKGLLMRTTNQGGTWRDISMVQKYFFTGVEMVNDSITIVCGSDKNSISKTKGILFRSKDNGKTFEKLKYLGNGYQDIAVMQPNIVYLLAIKRVFHSVSHGDHFWEGKYSGDRMAFAFDFFNDWGYMVGLKGYFAKTIDHGRSWTPINLDLDKHLYSVDMFDKSSGVAVGQDGVVIFFGDYADSYTVSSVGVNKDLHTVCATSTKIFCGGDDGTMLVMDRK